MRACCLSIALAALACRGTCEPTIRGGDDASRAAVARSVDRFLEALDPTLQFCVPKVVIDEDATPNGSYYRRTRRVEVVGEGAISNIIYHELCHAIDHQNDLPSGPIFEEAAELLYPELEGEQLQAEGFAILCSYGMTLGELLTDTCPGDGDDTGYRQTRAYFDGVDERWVDLEPDWVFDEVVRSAQPVLHGAFTVEVFEDGVVLTDADGPVPVSLPQPGFEVTGASVGRGGVTARLDEAALLHFDFGYDLVRRVRLDGSRFTSLGCWGANEQVFSFDGQFWSAFYDGEQLVVGRWVPSDGPDASGR